MKKRIFRSFGCTLLALILLTSATPAAMGTQTLTEPVLTNTTLEKLYGSYWAMIINTYLGDNGDGTFSRVEYTGEDVVVEQYDANLQFLGGQRLKMELPIFGGYFCGSDSHYLIFGQKNPDEQDGVEVIRVVRYSKDWQRLGHASHYSTNTYLPFRADMVRCAEYNGYLYVHTAHEMYTSRSGNRHQQNMSFNVRLSDMEIVQVACGGSSYGGLFISHTLNSFIIVDGETIVTADHNDTAYRAIQLHRLPQPAGQDNFVNKHGETMCAFLGGGNYTELGNYTGVEVGGLQASGSCYLTCGLTVDQTDPKNSKQKNVFVTATPKTDFTEAGTTVRYLTSYSEDAGVTLLNLHFVKLSEDRFALLWMEQTEKYVMRFAIVDGEGNLVGEITDIAGYISTCPPIFSGNRLLWYVTSGSGPIFMELDPQNPQSMTHRHVYKYTIAKKPTEKITGLLTCTCMTCGEAGPDVVIPVLLDTDAFEPYSSKDASCTEWGYRYYAWKDAQQYNASSTFLVQFPSLGHKTTKVAATAATCTEPGNVEHYHCERCGLNSEDRYGKTEIADVILPVDPQNHTYDETTHLCQCGARDPQFRSPILTGAGFTLSFEDEILVNFYYTAEEMKDATDHGMLVFYADPGTADFAKAADVYPGTQTANSCIATTSGIAAKEMGDERYYCAYAKLTDGTYAYSPLYSYSPKAYALSRLSNSADENLKALCVAMLNYGAAAQEYFGYRTDDLMNAGLTAEQQALVTAYDATAFKGAIAVDVSKTSAFAATAAGFSNKSASVSFEGAFAINYYLAPSAAVDGNMKLYIWTPEAYAAASGLTANNASAVVSMEAQANGAYWGQVQGIAAKNLDKTYYVAGVYTDKSGNTYCTGVMAYSLSKYCMNNAYGNMGQLAQATAMYGYYAAKYFA